MAKPAIQKVQLDDAGNARRFFAGKCILVAVGLIVLTALAEYAMGRLPISKSGLIRLWESNPDGPETSQQLADWYSFTHIIHGFLFYGILRLMVRRKGLVPLCFVIAIGVECAWEVLENSNYMIERYRQATISLGYYGDSILNSMSDILCCALGFVLARYFPVWLSIVFIIAVELMLLLAIRDNLTLNIIMLIHPVDAIKHWQMGLR